MARISFESNIRPSLCCVVILIVGMCSAAGAAIPIDKSKYITIDEIRPGMRAYCLTTYKGTEVEKFDLNVLDVVRNVAPGKNAILVQGTDERFIHTGPVSGCSGSPVYIDGRLAGALAFGWRFSKDPLYGVTPIAEMLTVGQRGGSEADSEYLGFEFDLSRPIDLDRIDRQMQRGYSMKSRAATASRDTGYAPLLCPLVTSTLPAEISEQLNASIEPFGLKAVAGASGGSTAHDAGASHTRLTPGASLAVPLITGDITMEAVGTVTEVIDDKVYGFGHSFLGYGPISLPMATGQVHTVVSSVEHSFKFAGALEIVGALTADESTAILGRIGAKAKMIPLKINVNRYNDQSRSYDCRLCVNRLFTPLILRAAVGGATLTRGSLPPEHMVQYTVNIGLEDAEPIRFENVSTDTGIIELMVEAAVPVALLMNNPYKKVDIKSLDFDVRVAPKSIASQIWSIDLSDTKVKPGQKIDASIVIESLRGPKKSYRCSFEIPKDLPPDDYEFIACGRSDYMEFLMKAAPYRFTPHNLKTLIEALRNILTVGRDRLFCLLVLPPGGIAVEKAELPDLPPTKALVLTSPKRALKIQPYAQWIEKTIPTGTVIENSKKTKITIEK